ncbi:MAG: NHL repeat-containing protein [Candidatus Tyrphobacter sp.]
MLAIDPVVSTYAGSGLPGIADGGASRASFLMPMGIVFDARGNLYVADAAAQRIREVSPSGHVSTLAGSGALVSGGWWVAPGYANGAAATARFNRPTGVAVAADGAVYVADSGNHCIRRVFHGEVTTFAGSPDRAGGALGSLTTAEFGKPMGLAFDRHGDLYVADEAWGVRRISRDGVVSAVGSLPEAYNVAIDDGEGGATVFVADFLGIDVVNPSGSSDRHFHALDTPVTDAREFEPEGGRQLGHPFGILALDDHSVVYTDLYTETVRYLSTYLGQVRTIAGLRNENAAGDGAQYRNGAGAGARFFAPSGIATYRGAIYVADAGDRRIRKLSAFDRRGAILAFSRLLPRTPTAPYRVAYVGNSFTFYDTTFSDSIEGRLENKLNHAGASGPQETSAVLPIWTGSNLEASASYLETLAPTGLFNVVVLQLNTANLRETYGVTDVNLASTAAAWQPKLATLMRSLGASLRRSNVALLIEIQPYGRQVALAENIYSQLKNATIEPPQLDVEELLSVPVRLSGARDLDLWPVFEAAERSNAGMALFMTNDDHFSRNGRALVADALYDALMRWRPWGR